MLTPEKAANFTHDEDIAPVLDTSSVEGSKNVDLENQANQSSSIMEASAMSGLPGDGDVVAPSLLDAPGNTMDINNSINDSVSTENCKFINESDAPSQTSPTSSKDNRVSSSTMVLDDSIIPSSANLTPVKQMLEPGLKEQDTFTSSPSGSHDDGHGGDSTISQMRPLSRRQQRMRILKCYGLVALIVLICAIGIPLGAVMIFKKNSDETSFESSQIAGDNSNSNNGPSVPEPSLTAQTNPPQFETEAPVVATDVPVVVTDAPVVATDAPVDVTDAPMVSTDAPEVTETMSNAVANATATQNPGNETDFFTTEVEQENQKPWTPDAKNVTSAPVEEQDNDLLDDLPITETATSQLGNDTVATDDAVEVVETTSDASLVNTEAPSAGTAAPTFAPTAGTANPTFRATFPPTFKPTMAPVAPTVPGPDRTTVYFDLINVTSPAILQDINSPQALSYLWLVDKDQTLPVPSGKKLIQRYVLVVMDHTLHVPFATSMAQPSADECDWEGIVCNEEGDVMEINWSRQGFNGGLVAEMKELRNLTKLDLSENDCVGNLDALYETRSLSHVYLNNNKFSGKVSEQIGLLEQLEVLYLGHNQLTGNIPISLRSYRDSSRPLKWLVMSHNNLTGFLPWDWRVRNLFYLDLGYNQLSGPLPNDWDRNMVRLRHLYLDHNRFTGSVPSYFGQLGNGRLKQLHLNDNLLEGEVPINWDPKDQLTSMSLQNNNLTVPIDESVCDMSVYHEGVMVEMRVDCPICTCDTLCHTCV